MIRGRKSRLTPTNVGAAHFLEYIRARNWSQRDAAKLLGWPLQRLQRILQEKSELKVSEAFEIQAFTEGEVAPRTWTMRIDQQD